MKNHQTQSIIPKTWRESSVRLGLLFLIIISALSSLIDGGVFSSSYRPASTFFVLVPYLLAFYLMIIIMMRSFGLSPNKFELFFIPTIIIFMLYLGLFFTGFMNQIEFDPSDSNTVSEVVTESQLGTGTIDITTGGDDQIPTTTEVRDSEIIPDRARDVFSFVIILSIFIFVILIALYIRKMKNEFNPDFGFGREIEYSKSPFKNNMDIIASYKESSINIESYNGMAPHWYSPTRFDNSVSNTIGPPLSSYFNKLTDLFELARFSNHELGMDKVSEALDLSKQIYNTLDDIKQKFMEAHNNG